MRILIFFLFLTVAANGQTPEIALVDSFMKAQVQVKKFNGNVLVAKAGNILYEKSFGYSNYDTKQLLDKNSLFDLASVSKQFTAMAILLLKEKGKLSLSDSLRQYFPELPYNRITVRHILTHTSGLPDYEEAMNEKWDKKKIAFNEDVIAFLAKEKTPVLFSPGSRWMYSNTGYALLASIVEKVSGQKFPDFLKTNIFTPLQMTRTRVYNTRRSSKEILSNYAYGYVYADSQKKYVLPDSVPALDFVRYLDGIQGDGVVNSTTGDLLKWNQALRNNTLLPKDSQAEMLSAQEISDSTNKISYGYGVFVGQDTFGNVRFHSGGWPGYVTFLTHYPEQDLTIIILSNNGSRSPSVSNQIAHLMHGKPVQFPYEHREMQIDNAVTDKFIGKYQDKDILEVIKVDGKLYRKGKKDVELKPESTTKFFYADGSDRQIEFEINNAGLVEKAWLIVEGIKYPRTKVE